MKTMRTKKKGAVVTGIIAVFAMMGVTVAFVSSASPYVTANEARHSTGSRLHLAGKIDTPTLVDDRLHRELRFTLIDKDGGKIQVIHTGDPISNLADAKQVVAIGHVVNGVFISEQMLVKCPTKYEAGDSKSGA
jgi:cytochrome c-type biogenesis protein CcmE